MILSDEIIINDMPILKDIKFKGFEKYIKNNSNKTGKEIKLNNDIISIDQNITYIKSATLYKAKKMENQYIFYIKDIKYSKDITIQNSIEVIIEIKLQDTNETEEINRCFLFNTLISCSFEASESLIENEYDITIKDGFSIPLYNTTILKSKLEGYSTYTVKAGKIQKLSSKTEEDVSFNIIDITKTLNLDIKNITFNYYIYYKKDIQDKHEIKCSLKDNIINCVIEGEKNYPEDIVFPSEDPEIMNLNKYSIFFENFKNKRTFTIRPGNLVINQCKKDNENSYLEFEFLNNIMPDEEIVFTTNFELNVTINEEGNIKADCVFTYDNNKITYLTCKAKYDCKEENELIIDDNDTIEKFININNMDITIYFEGFSNIESWI